MAMKNESLAWWAVNGDYVLPAGDFGREDETGLVKRGDGVLSWSALPYAGVQQLPGLRRSARQRSARGHASVSVITNFQTGHGWSLLSGTTGNLNDANAGHVVGSQCAWFQCDAGQARGMRKLAGTPVNLTGRFLGILLRVDNPDILDGSTTFSLDVGDSSLANFWRMRIDSDKAQQFFTGATPRADGGGYWAHYTIPWEPGGDWITVTGTPNRAAVTDFQIRMSLAAGEPASRVAVQEIYSVPESTAYPNGILCVVADDGKDSFLTLGRPVMDALGIPGTVYLQAYSTDRADKGLAPAYAPSSKMLDAQRWSGWAFCAHAYSERYTPDPGYTAYYPEDARKDWLSLQQWLKERGFTGWEHSSYPNGNFSYVDPPATPANARVNEVAEQLFLSSRTIFDRCPETLPPGDPNRLRTIYVTSGTTLSAVQTALQKCAQSKGVAIVVFHELVTGAAGASTEWNLSDFTTALTYAIQTLGMKAATIPDVFGVNGPVA